MSKFEPAVSASTLAVLQNENGSITCYLELDSESSNVSLNLEQDTARILGYPQDWGVHDANIDQGDSDSPTYEEVIEQAENDVEGMPVYVSKMTEVEIFTQLKTSLKKQFEDEMFKDDLTDEQKEIALNKIDKAIAQLG